MTTKEFLEFLKEKNHLIINHKDHYSEAQTGKVFAIDGNAVKFYWTSDDDKTEARGLVTYDMQQFAQLVNPFLIVDRSCSFSDKYYSTLQSKIKKNWHEVINTLHSSPHKRLKVDDCVDLLVTSIGVTKLEASGILKSHLAVGTFKYDEFKSSEFIILGRNTIELENKKRYLSSISSEIRSQSERINYIISHGQTVGNYREQLFISVLRKYVPKKFHVATGFIEGSNKQIDIIIYDQHNYIPVFREDDLVVVKKESVAAVIEVKTTLTSATIADSLKGIEKICEGPMNSIPFFKGIFAFNTKMNNKSAANTIASFYKKNGIHAIYDHLDVVCVPNKICGFIDYNNLENDEYSCPSLYIIEDAKGISIGESFFFQRLFAFLEVENSAKKINGFYFSVLRETASLSLHQILTHNDWTPFHSFISEIRGTADFEPDMEIIKNDVKKRIKDVRNWMMGEMKRELLIEKYNND
ncbi:DUF6602 domain-containing protein [Flavobacterium plurextorum]|uniref:DUF6602 domain-containing protein n=2 Tax=Flavobacterium TaxID=237 RepID=A0A9X1KQ94_9FLAO|nr:MULTISPECIES: DUF6602 domain-containing protein [Flavobacterium]MBW1658636.1 hypothetical protein [Flavobacterium quisquiliarum]MBZ4035259.1 hypothetical protein [Flavobacterium potami]WET02511.1 hypothetical protein P0R33_22410 [Flavobacterium sp. YJ01]